MLNNLYYYLYCAAFSRRKSTASKAHRGARGFLWAFVLFVITDIGVYGQIIVPFKLSQNVSNIWIFLAIGSYILTTYFFSRERWIENANNFFLNKGGWNKTNAIYGWIILILPMIALIACAWVKIEIHKWIQ